MKTRQFLPEKACENFAISILAFDWIKHHSTDGWLIGLTAPPRHQVNYIITLGYN